MNIISKFRQILSASALRIAKLSILRKPAKIYLVIALLFGLAFLVTSPPCAVPDEPVHLYRIFRIAQGTFFSGAEIKLPDLDAYCDLCNLVGFDRESQNLKTQLKMFLTSPGGSLDDKGLVESYTPLPYLPAATSVKALMFLKPNLAVFLYVARLATFLAALAITYYAICITPYGRWLFVVLALMPTRLFLMASFSPDAITSALALLWVAIILARLLKNDLLSPRNLVELVFVAVALALTKSMYCLLLFLPICLVFRKVNSKKMLAGFVLFFVCMAGFAVLALKYHPIVLTMPSIKTQPLNTQSAAGSGANYFLAQVNSSAQLKLLLEDPLRIPSVLLKGYGTRGQNLLRGSTAVFGQTNLYLSSWMYLIGYTLIIMSFYLDRKIKALSEFKLISFITFLSALIAIPLIMYLYWTPVGAKGFDGVQGRYYIPYLPLVFLALGCRGQSILRMRILRFFVVIGLTSFLILSVFRITDAYYLSPPAGGVVVIHAQADNTGVAWIAIKSNHREKWRNKGVINLIPSEQSLIYECRVPAQEISSLRVILDTTGSMNIRIDAIEFRTLDGRLVKNIRWEDVKQNGVQGLLVEDVLKDHKSHLFRLSKQGHSSLLIIDKVGVDLRY